MSLLHDIVAKMEAQGDPADAVAMARYHKATRRVLGVKVPVLDALSRALRAEITLGERLTLADGLWRTDVHEARVLAAKLLDQGRIRPDDAGAWALIQGWVPHFDAWAIADHACIAGQKRLLADPRRLEAVERWTGDASMWTRRAALVITLPWAKFKQPTAEQRAARERVLAWAAGYAGDPAWFMQKAVGWWLRELSRAEPDRVRAFIAQHGAQMKPFARKEALRLLDGGPGASLRPARPGRG
jgi:3-methyladenine DNA glycosylase AlkD